MGPPIAEGLSRIMKMKRTAMLLLFLCIASITCKESKSVMIRMSELEIQRAVLLHRRNPVCTIEDQNALSDLRIVLLDAKVDESDDNFKSYYFLEIFLKNQHKIRLEVKGFRFRFGRKRYQAKRSIQALLNELCG